MTGQKWCESLTWAQGVRESVYTIDDRLAYLFSSQPSNYTAPVSGGRFSFAMLSEMLDKLYNAPVVFHGSQQDPHLYHPNPRSFWYRFCSTCGFPRDEETAEAAVEVLRAELARSGINT